MKRLSTKVIRYSRPTNRSRELGRADLVDNGSGSESKGGSQKEKGPLVGDSPRSEALSRISTANRRTTKLNEAHLYRLELMSSDREIQSGEKARESLQIQQGQKALLRSQDGLVRAGELHALLELVYDLEVAKQRNKRLRQMLEKKRQRPTLKELQDAVLDNDADTEHADEVIPKHMAKLKKYESSLYQKHTNNLSGYTAEIESKIKQLRDAIGSEEHKESNLVSKIQHACSALVSEEASKSEMVNRATVIQSAFRMKQERKKFMRFVMCVMKIQRVFHRFRRGKAALCIQTRARVALAVSHREKRFRAIRTLQRFAVARRLRKAEHRERAAALATAKLKMRAANRFHAKIGCKTAFTAWKEFLSLKVKAKAVIVHCMDKFYGTRVNYSFQRWWLSTRMNFRVQTIAGVRAVVQDKGSTMPLIHLYKQHFVPTSRVLPNNEPSACYARGSWKDTVPLGHNELTKFTKRLTLKREILAASASGAARLSSIDHAIPTYNGANRSLARSPSLEIASTAVRKRLQEFQQRKRAEEQQDTNWMYPSVVARSMRTRSKLSKRDELVIQAASTVKTPKAVAQIIDRVSEQREENDLIVQQLKRRKEQRRATKARPRWAHNKVHPLTM